MTFLLPIIMALTITTASPTSFNNVPPPAPPPSADEVTVQDEPTGGQQPSKPCVFDDNGNLVCFPS